MYQYTKQNPQNFSSVFFFVSVKVRTLRIFHPSTIQNYTNLNAPSESIFHGEFNERTHVPILEKLQNLFQIVYCLGVGDHTKGP